MKRNRAFTLIEVMASVAVIGIIVAIAIGYASSGTTVTKQHKLDSDVASINQAISAYIGFGGSVSEITGAVDVLSRLKSQQLDSEKASSTGVTGSFVDRRLRALLMSEEEAASDELRAIWDPEAAQFVIARSGYPAVKAFYFSQDEEAVAAEARPGFFNYAKEDSWVWDYEDRAPLVKPQPTSIAMASPTEPPPSGGTASVGRLSPPGFSVVPGAKPIGTFPFQLSLTNPNPGGSSTVMYRVNGGAWTIYSGPFTVPPGASVLTYAHSADSTRWRDSSQATGAYTAISQQLQPPLIATSASKFNYEAASNVTVTLTNPNADGLGDLYYSLDGESFQAYHQPFVLDVRQYEEARATIHAYVQPKSSHYLRSDTAQRTVEQPDPLFLISAQTAGSFHSPQGPLTLIALPVGNQITWGTPPIGFFANQLIFNGQRVDSIQPGKEFVAGTITYRNGSVLLGTAMTSVTMRIQLNINSGSPLIFNFKLDTISTENYGVDQRADADYVRLPSTVAEAVTIDGRRFILELSFGWTTVQGFATDNQFHVFEGGSATAEVRGKFIHADL